MPSTIRYTGKAPAVKKAGTVTAGGSPGAADIYTITIGSATAVAVADASPTNIEIAAALYLAVIDADAAPEFGDVDWTDPNGTAILSWEVRTAGVDVTITSGSSGAGTLVTATTTAVAGPRVASTVTNYSGGALPSAGDSLVIDDPDVVIEYAPTALAGIALAEFTCVPGVKIGLPRRNTGGYVEYRTRHLSLDADVVNVGLGEGGSGTGRVNLNLAANSTVVNCYATGSREDNALPAVLLKGATGHDVNVFGGDCGAAAETGDSISVTNLRLAAPAPGADVKFYGGTGLTLTNAFQYGGSVTCRSAVTALVKTGGTWTQLAGVVTAVENTGGGFVLMTTAEVTAATFYGGGGSYMDCSQDPRVKDVEAATFTTGARLVDPNETVVPFDAFTFDKASLLASDIGERFTVTRA